MLNPKHNPAGSLNRHAEIQKPTTDDPLYPRWVEWVATSTCLSIHIANRHRFRLVECSGGGKHVPCGVSASHVMRY